MICCSDGTIQTSSFTNNGLIEGYGTIVGNVGNQNQGNFLLLKISFHSNNILFDFLSEF
jgi:hypothetical protein